MESVERLRRGYRFRFRLWGVAERTHLGAELLIELVPGERLLILAVCVDREAIVLPRPLGICGVEVVDVDRSAREFDAEFATRCSAELAEDRLFQLTRAPLRGPDALGRGELVAHDAVEVVDDLRVAGRNRVDGHVYLRVVACRVSVRTSDNVLKTKKIIKTLPFSPNN